MFVHHWMMLQAQLNDSKNISECTQKHWMMLLHASLNDARNFVEQVICLTGNPASSNEHPCFSAHQNLQKKNQIK